MKSISLKATSQLLNAALFTLLCTSPLLAHDTWVQTNTNLIRTGDAMHIDLKLGNHGNEHRDFKLAGKADLESSTLKIIDPKGKSYDIKSELADTGYAPDRRFLDGEIRGDPTWALSGVPHLR